MKELLEPVHNIHFCQKLSDMLQGMEHSILLKTLWRIYKYLQF